MTLILMVTAASGCATVTRGVNETLVIESSPAGATAELSTGETCETPCTFRVRRRGEFAVTVRKTGFETARAIVTSRLDGTGMALGGVNVVLGGPSPIAGPTPLGLIGAGLDVVTGAMHTLKPNPVHVVLEPADP